MAHAGLQTLLSYNDECCPVYQALTVLFLTETSLSQAFQGMCLKAGMHFKGTPLEQTNRWHANTVALA